MVILFYENENLSHEYLNLLSNNFLNLNSIEIFDYNINLLNDILLNSKNNNIINRIIKYFPEISSGLNDFIHKNNLIKRNYLLMKIKEIRNIWKINRILSNSQIFSFYYNSIRNKKSLDDYFENLYIQLKIFNKTINNQNIIIERLMYILLQAINIDFVNEDLIAEYFVNKEDKDLLIELKFEEFLFNYSNYYLIENFILNKKEKEVLNEMSTILERNEKYINLVNKFLFKLQEIFHER